MIWMRKIPQNVIEPEADGLNRTFNWLLVQTSFFGIGAFVLLVLSTSLVHAPVWMPTASLAALIGLAAGLAGAVIVFILLFARGYKDE